MLHTDGTAVEQFLDFALRDYVRLEEERSGILRDSDLEAFATEMVRAFT